MRNSILAAIGMGMVVTSVPALGAPLLQNCVGARYLTPAAPTASNSGDLGLVPVPRNTLGCTRGVSLTVGSQTIIWRCEVVLPPAAEFAEGQPAFGFLIQRPNQVLQELPDEVMVGAFRNFDVITVDLDQNGTLEHILAAWNGQGNGLGIHVWTIYVFDAQWNLARRFDNVSDWGRGNLVKAASPRRGCDIAITTYPNTAARGKSTGGIRLRAQFFAAQPRRGLQGASALAIVAAQDRPSLERRYTRAFERQRLSWFSRGEWQWRGNIADWLNNPATVSRP